MPAELTERSHRLPALLLCSMTALVLLGLVPGAASPALRAHGWTRTGLGAVTQPAPVGDRFVLLAHHSGSLQVVALNALDGRTAWTAAATPSGSTAGVAASLAIHGDLVFYLGRAGAFTGAAQVVARDVRSGSVVWQTPVGGFSSWPEICPDEPAVVCVTGFLPNGTTGELRFAAATGKPLGTIKVGTATYPGRELSPDLFDPGNRSPELLVATKAGRIVWHRPVSQIFTLPHASSDGGWNLGRFAHHGLYVGSIGTTPVIKNGKATINLGATMTAGFSLGSGKVAWRAPGLYSCYVLPCAGEDDAGYSAADQAAYPEPSVPLRTVAKGKATFATSGGAPKISAGASITIQGFDPATGRTTWSFNAGRNIGLISELAVPPRIDEDTIVLREGPQRLVALDLRNGSHHPVSPTAAAWCEATPLYRLSNSQYYGGKSGQYVGQHTLFACTADGHRRPVPAGAPALVKDIGATADGITAWTDSSAVHGS